MLRAGNPMTRVLMTLTAFEVIVFALSVFVMVQVSHVALPTALIGGLGAALLALLTTVTLRRPVGFWLGWLTQVAAVGLGLLTPSMFVMAAVFGGLWVVSFILGKRLEAAADEAERGSAPTGGRQ